MNSQEMAQWLEDAADVLETGGWGRGSYFNHRTSAHCALGALARARNAMTADGTVAWTSSYMQDATSVTRAMGFRQSGELLVWNDEQDTASEVIDLFKNTAKDLRNRTVAE